MRVLNSAIQPFRIKSREYKLQIYVQRIIVLCLYQVLHFMWISFSRNMNSVSMLEMREGVTVTLEYLHTKRRECLNRSD